MLIKELLIKVCYWKHLILVFVKAILSKNWWDFFFSIKTSFSFFLRNSIRTWENFSVSNHNQYVSIKMWLGILFLKINSSTQKIDVLFFKKSPFLPAYVKFCRENRIYLKVVSKFVKSSKKSKKGFFFKKKKKIAFYGLLFPFS